jgi:hypothetical protein
LPESNSSKARKWCALRSHRLPEIVLLRRLILVYLGKFAVGVAPINDLSSGIILENEYSTLVYDSHHKSFIARCISRSRERRFGGNRTSSEGWN